MIIGLEFRIVEKGIAEIITERSSIPANLSENY